jgi:hypothetical protein
MAIFDSYVSLPEGIPSLCHDFTTNPWRCPKGRTPHDAAVAEAPEAPPGAAGERPSGCSAPHWEFLKRRVKENIVTTMIAYDVHWLPCVFSFEWFEMVIFEWCIKLFTFDWNSEYSDLIDTNTCMESRPFAIWSCSLEKNVFFMSLC